MEDIWYYLLAAAAFTGASAVAAADFLQKKAIPGALISALTAVIWSGASALLWPQGEYAAVPVGQAVCLAGDLVRKRREELLPEGCFYLACDGVLLPLFLCGDGAIWKYAAYGALFLACVAVACREQKKEAHHPLCFLPEQRGRYSRISMLPCAVLLPEGMLLLAAGRLSVRSALLFGTAFLGLSAVIFWLQQEIVLRVTAQEWNRAMSRWQYESRDYMNTIRSQRHDFNLHLHAISGLTESGEYTKCREYIQKLVAEANAVNDIMPVNDAVVGSMLYNMREEARRHGSEITYHIMYDMRDIICNGFECNKIIGNLLQNAIDALQTEEDRQTGIRLGIFKRRGNTVITCENRFTGDPERIARVFEAGYSTKRNHDGIGLSMVQRTAQQYGGRVYPEFEEDRIRFVVNIPNKVRLLSEGDTE